MMFLAGLMGMVLVGATVFVGMDDTESAAESDAAMHGETEANAAVEPGVARIGETIAGGESPESISGGAGDIMPAGGRPGTIFVSDWAPDGGAEFPELDLSKDTLVVLYDDEAGDQSLELNLIQDEADATVTHVVLNGDVVLTLHDAAKLRLGDIQLVPRSAANLLMQGAA